MISACKHDHDHSQGFSTLAKKKKSFSQIRKMDPTRTTVLRNKFAAAFYKRFMKLKSDIRKSIVDRDCFNLQPEKFLMINEPVPLPKVFDFPTSSGKVNAFMEWLHDQADQGILGIIEREGRTITKESEWMKIYLDSAYKKGILRAQSEMSKTNLPYMRPLGASFLSPIHADRAGLIYTRTYETLKGITEDMSKGISQVLSDGIVKGLHPLEIAKSISPIIDKNINRARMLARTEVIRAHHIASINEYREAGLWGVKVLAEWGTAGIGVCEKCLEMASRDVGHGPGIYTLDEIEGLIPLHPNCLINGSRISTEGITAASKRWYNGDIIIITTAGGKNLSCTPNHPILTRNGFIPARLLDIGSDIICSIPGNLDISESTYNKNMPPTIKEITESFGSPGKVSTIKMKVSTPDFHGDGKGSNIAIIRTNSELRDEFNPSIFKHLPKDFFQFRDMAKTFLFPFGSKAKIFKRSFFSSNRIMSSFDKVFFLLFSHLFPSEGFSFALSPTGSISHNKISFNNSSTNFKFFGQRKLTFPCFIEGNNFINRKFFFPEIFRSVSSINNSFVDNFVSDSKLPSYICNGSTGKVFIDKIINIKSRAFSGHVYNLQTKKGFYVAEGIFTHNCKCTTIPQIDEKMQEKLQPLNKEIFALSANRLWKMRRRIRRNLINNAYLVI